MTKSWNRAAPHQDHYQEVTDKIIAILEKGVLPWRRQWDAGRCDVPVNAVTRHTYRGINRVVLDMLGMRFGADPRWCSYRQALARGWQVRRGESGTRIYFSSDDLWAEVALHEFAYASGALSRLDRKLSTIFGSSDYAFEELIVSLATSMAGPELGVAVDFDNQASYIDDWLGALKREKKTIFRAAAAAQRVADYILGLHPDYAAAHAQPDRDGDNDPTEDASDALAEAA
jgi:antirestriction protein ArdC